MKSGPFINLVAEAYGIEAKTVRVYARALKEAGLFTSGARGVNAPHITPLDSARITIAILTTPSPVSGPDAVRRYENYTPTPLGDEQEDDLEKVFGSSLLQALERLFSGEQDYLVTDLTFHETTNNFELRLGPDTVVFDDNAGYARLRALSTEIDEASGDESRHAELSHKRKMLFDNLFQGGSRRLRITRGVTAVEIDVIRKGIQIP